MRMTDLFRREKVLLGMVHLLPLPGSPRWGGSLRPVLEAALADAKALEAGGLGGCLGGDYAGAAGTGAGFVRVNVHVGAVLADQGIIQGDAYGTLRYRRMLSADVKIFADVLAKHGAPLAPLDGEQEAREAAYRGLAEAPLVSG